jgi:UDP-N-acetylmuramate dehydrogenase
MNAGTRYGEVVSSLEAVDIVTKDGQRERLTPKEMDFGYRRSGLPEGAVITNVVLALRDSPAGELRKLVGSWLKEKQSSQPVKSFNFGCMFKNPVGHAAGKLIDVAGLKGSRRGGAQISEVHGNFIENLGSAKAEDVLGLIELCEERVLKESGIRLEREVRVVCLIP